MLLSFPFAGGTSVAEVDCSTRYASGASPGRSRSGIGNAVLPVAVDKAGSCWFRAVLLLYDGVRNHQRSYRRDLVRRSWALSAPFKSINSAAGIPKSYRAAPPLG